jgi:hypothetical protein
MQNGTYARLSPSSDSLSFPLILDLPPPPLQIRTAEGKISLKHEYPGRFGEKKGHKAHAQNRHKPPNNAKPTRNSKSRLMRNGASQLAKSRRKSSLRARLVLFGWVSTLLPLRYFTWTDLKRAEGREAEEEVFSGRDGYRHEGTGKRDREYDGCGWDW